MRTALLTLAFLTACAGAARAGPPPVLAGHEQGRTVWTGTCEVCHAEPASGAPLLGDAKACISCHNEHKDSPRTDFKMGEVMGGVVIRLPM